MIIKHTIELETEINEEKASPLVMLQLDNMTSQEVHKFFDDAAREFIRNYLVEANEGHTWAEVRVVN